MLKHILFSIIFFICLFIFKTDCKAETIYVIQRSIDNEIFIINDEIFRAQLVCFNWSRGDRVIFVEGSPFGFCITAKIINLDKETVCNVFCE